MPLRDVTACPTCQGPFTRYVVGGETLMGFSSPPGHDHDDNCQKRAYYCADGHGTVLSAQRRCMRATCTWRGKAECETCGHDKLAEWPPDVPQDADQLALIAAYTSVKQRKKG